MCFPHQGRIVTIGKISFVGHNLNPNLSSYLNGLVVLFNNPPHPPFIDLIINILLINGDPL